MVIKVGYGEGCVSPDELTKLESDSVEEISGVGVLERVCLLTRFIEEVHRVLKVGGKASFTAPHYASNLAWNHPCTIRGVSEMTMNFASKQWREQNKELLHLACDFVVGCNFAVDPTCMNRSEDAKQFWLSRYNNVAQAIMFTLEKK